MSERLLFSKTLRGSEPIYRPFTPTWTNLTVGNATQDFEYAVIGKFVHYQGQLTFGSTTSVSGTITVNVPTTQDGSIAGCIYSTVRIQDSGIKDYACALYATGSGFLVGALASGDPYLQWGGSSSTVPFTFGTGDSITFSVYYKVA